MRTFGCIRIPDPVIRTSGGLIWHDLTSLLFLPYYLHLLNTFFLKKDCLVIIAALLVSENLRHIGSVETDWCTLCNDRPGITTPLVESSLIGRQPLGINRSRIVSLYTYNETILQVKFHIILLGLHLYAV